MCALISDKTIPFAASLAGALRSRDYSVALLDGSVEQRDSKNASPVSAVSDSSVLLELPWNRSSSLSAQTLMLGVRNSFSVLDLAVVVFDMPFFAGTVATGDRIALVSAVDEYVRGYMLVIQELVALFKKQKKGRLVFVVREMPATGSSPSAKNIPISVACAAFMRLAEETALECSGAEQPEIQTLQVKLEQEDDNANLDWLVSQLSAPASQRGQCRWIKAGSRGLFGKI